jgi:hypothetical protein
VRRQSQCPHTHTTHTRTRTHARTRTRISSHTNLCFPRIIMNESTNLEPPDRTPRKDVGLDP